MIRKEKIYKEEVAKINGDFLLEEMPCLKIDDKDYLVYSPHKKLFVKIPFDALYKRHVITYLRNEGFLHFPKLNKNTVQSIKVVLNITKKCNLYCKYCWANSGPNVNNNEMSPSIATKIIRDFSKSNRIERIHFMGGEPTTNFKAIEAVVTYCNNSVDPLPVFYITTNGVIHEKVLKWLIRNKFSFSISWDGLLEGHDTQRPYIDGTGSEEKVRNSILRVAEEGLPLRVRLTISKLNMPYLYESISWLADHNVKYVHVEPVSPIGRGLDFTNKYAPNPDEFVDEFFQVVELAEKKGIWVLNSSLANLYTPRDYYCGSLKERVYHFNSDGSISRCYKVQGFADELSTYFVIGNYRAEDGVIKIDKVKSANLSSISVSKYPECNDYFIRNFYSGGCPYRNFTSTRSWTKVDPYMHRISQLLLKKAILHIYRQTLKGKTSALEGLLLFYKTLVRENVQAHSQDVPEASDIGNISLAEKLYSIKLIPIPMVSRDQFVEIDTCDICI